MRLVTIGGIAALASAVALAACSDQPSGSDLTGPLAKNALVEGARLRAQGSGSLSVMTARGMRTQGIEPWSASGSIRGGLGRDEGTSSPLGVLAVSSAMRAGIGETGGFRRSDVTDAKGVRHTLVAFYGADGGPPRALQVYAAGKLIVASAMEWAPRGRGWVLRSATHHVYRDGAVVAELKATIVAPLQVATRGLAPDALRLAASGAIRLLAPRELAAQSFLSRCWKENLEVIALTATLAGLIASAEALPVLTPAIQAAIIATAAKLIQAEMAFWLCMQNSGGPIIPGGKPLLPPLDCPHGGDPLICGLSGIQ
jgi:hypothetical protein